MFTNIIKVIVLSAKWLLGALIILVWNIVEAIMRLFNTHPTIIELSNKETILFVTCNMPLYEKHQSNEDMLVYIRGFKFLGAILKSMDERNKCEELRRKMGYAESSPEEYIKVIAQNAVDKQMSEEL